MELWLVGFLLLAFAWKCLCSHLRRRRSELLASLDPSLDNSHAINASTISVEFPFIFQRSVELGIMRTFAIPSISRTLQKGGQYAKNVSKRYDDTEILLTEMMVHHIDAPRGSLAVRRLNFLHSHYNIDNADYLYVLCLTIVFPAEWAARYAYREWTELEKTCFYKTWHDVGTRMGLRDIPPSFAAAAKYKDDFEDKHMAYAESNHEIAELNMKLLLNNMPALLRPVIRRVIYALLDDRFRAAIGYPKQPAWLRALSHGLLKLHGIAVSWMPPRPLAWARLRISYGCPAPSSANGNDAAAGVLPLAFQRYKPVPYQKGYRISELGALKLGRLGNAFQGDIICSLEKSNSRPWPTAFTLKKEV